MRAFEMFDQVPNTYANLRIVVLLRHQCVRQLSRASLVTQLVGDLEATTRRRWERRISGDVLSFERGLVANLASGCH
jgi:hypothetical protein